VSGLTFLGIVHPQHESMTLSPPVQLILTRDGRTTPIVISINAGIVTVKVDGPFEGPLLDLKNTAADAVAAIADAAGFVQGAAYSVEISFVLFPDGSSQRLTAAFDQLKEDLDGLRVDELSDFQATLIGLALNSSAHPEVATALNELAQGIRRPLETPLHAFRAVEAVRQRYLEAEGTDRAAERKRSWEALRVATKVSAAELDWLAQLAIPNRHGARPPIPETDRMRALRVARAVLMGHVRSQL
jgi:hypothetical protein